MENDPLYTKIMEFDIDNGPVDLPFSERLALENGWSFEFAHRVVLEYKRFVYLLATANFPITPSDQIDQVWHLHLTYTESYWQRLWTEVVGRPLHHTPTRGGVDESDKFYSWYNRALENYQQAFGHAPPPDIWPSPKIRFGEDLNFQRVNTSRFWVVRKPKNTSWQALRTQLLAYLVLAVGVLVVVGVSWVVTHTRIRFDLSMITGIIAISWFVSLYKNRCLNCQCYGALKATGAVDTREDKKECLELRCNYCGTRVWKERSDDGCGGGGGGGGGGCGGCGG